MANIIFGNVTEEEFNRALKLYRNTSKENILTSLVIFKEDSDKQLNDNDIREAIETFINDEYYGESTDEEDEIYIQVVEFFERKERQDRREKLRSEVKHRVDNGASSKLEKIGQRIKTLEDLYNTAIDECGDYIFNYEGIHNQKIREMSEYPEYLPDIFRLNQSVEESLNIIRIILDLLSDLDNMKYIPHFTDIVVEPYIEWLDQLIKKCQKTTKSVSIIQSKFLDKHYAPGGYVYRKAEKRFNKKESP